jgi:hypothetical protein
MSNVQCVDRLLALRMIKPNPLNAHSHSKAQIRALADIIYQGTLRTFG